MAWIIYSKRMRKFNQRKDSDEFQMKKWILQLSAKKWTNGWEWLLKSILSYTPNFFSYPNRFAV